MPDHRYREGAHGATPHCGNPAVSFTADRRIMGPAFDDTGETSMDLRQENSEISIRTAGQGLVDITSDVFG